MLFRVYLLLLLVLEINHVLHLCLEVYGWHAATLRPWRRLGHGCGHDALMMCDVCRSTGSRLYLYIVYCMLYTDY